MSPNHARHPLPYLPNGDDWLSTRDIALLIAGSETDRWSLRTHLPEIWPPSNATEREIKQAIESAEREISQTNEAAEHEIRKVMRRIHQYLDQGLPVLNPFPRSEARAHNRLYWKRSTIERWRASAPEVMFNPHDDWPLSDNLSSPGQQRPPSVDASEAVSVSTPLGAT